MHFDLERKCRVARTWMQNEVMSRLIKLSISEKGSFSYDMIMFAFQFSSMTYRITRPGLPAIMFAGRHSLEAAARQPGAELQRLREEVASRGPECLGTAVADMRKEELRELCVAAGLRVKSTDGKLWLKMPELREALLAYLSSDAEKAGICLMASFVVNMRNWNEKVNYTACLSHSKENGLHQDNYQ